MEKCLMTEITVYCQLVSLGAKPMGLMAFDSFECEAAISIVNKYKLKHYIKSSDSGWCTFYIYKHENLYHVIKELPVLNHSLKDLVLLGLLQGYDIKSVCDSVEELEYLKE